MSSPSPIFVTQPSLPPLADFLPYLQRIWDTKQLSNSGPFHRQFELELAEYLGVPYISLFANATLALVTALKALRITGEVITTPYSFVATAHALTWNGISPVFADVQPGSLNLDPDRVEAAITPQTTAIMPVHCYGRPCDVERIQRIADDYNLKVIYDAAHAFGIRVESEGRWQSLLRHGDLAVLSFHATKVFNTFEGGAIICPDARTKQHIDHLKNFGYVNETTVVAAGINGKMSEFNAALGLLQLQHVDRAIERRRAIDRLYRDRLAGLRGLKMLAPPERATSNCSYMPVLVDEDFPVTRDELYAWLRSHGVVARRYFYPLITDFPMYRQLPSADRAGLPVAAAASAQVLCLPIYPDLADADVERICGLVRGAQAEQPTVDLAQVA